MKILDKCCNKFTEHPKAIKENYFQHMKCALSMAKEAMIISVVLTIHACCPFCFQDTGSTKIEKLNEVVQNRKRKCHVRT